MENFKMRLCGKSVDITESNSDDWSDNWLGRSNTKKAQILICSTMPGDVKMETLLHETIHFIARDNGLSFRDNEQDVSTMSIAMFSWMRDNPELVAHIARGGA